MLCRAWKGRVARASLTTPSPATLCEAMAERTSTSDSSFPCEMECGEAVVLLVFEDLLKCLN
jgi:hypothetical protein